MIIGTFRYIAEDDVYVGRIGTPAGRMSVTFNAQKSGPDYRITIHDADAELGAAWKRTSRERKPYLSVKLDSPFLPQPVNCALIPERPFSVAFRYQYLAIYGRSFRKAYTNQTNHGRLAGYAV
jgi:uncharacterized protein (DUF736 family)